MTVETDLYARLTGFAGLTALVSTRVYANLLPQNVTFPAIAYRRISATRTSCMGVDVKNVKARFQFDVYAETYTSLRAVTEQVRLALQRYSGTNSVEIEVCFFLNELEFFEDEIKVHRNSLDFEINYKES